MAFRMKAATSSMCYPVGTIVYPAKYFDYGCASDDSQITGIEHVSVTLKPDGEYPFFTIPKKDLEEVTNDEATGVLDGPTGDGGLV